MVVLTRVLVVGMQVILVLAGFVLPNGFLSSNACWLYGIQAVSLLAFLLPRLEFAKNLFLPSFFVFVYVSVNLTLGGYLAPRAYGWDKQFADPTLNNQNYNVIVPYMLVANLVLVALTLSSIRRMAINRDRSCFLLQGDGAGLAARLSLVNNLLFLLKSAAYFGVFFAVGFFQVFSSFSLQMAVMILHLSSPMVRFAFHRYLAYSAYLILLVLFSFENKREIAVALFLVLFLESYHQKIRLRLDLRSLVLASFGALTFLALILAASILRGYADVPVESILQAAALIPSYMSSDVFIDGLTDNLELSYSYGASITAIDLVLGGRIDFQYGASILKVLFLPFSRELLPWKPESVMQIFTQEFAPAWWAEDGSMPVSLASEMFVNFHVAGIVAYAAIMAILNRIFESIDHARLRTLRTNSCVFLSVTVLFYARGSGIEQWVLYYLVALPVFVIYSGLRGASNAAGMLYSAPISRIV